MKVKRNRPAKPFEITTIKADQQRFDDVTRTTRRRLVRGEAMRCAACLNWVEAATAKVVVYVSPTDDYTGYVLCPRCEVLSTVSQSVRRNISAYVAGISS